MADTYSLEQTGLEIQGLLDKIDGLGARLGTVSFGNTTSLTVTWDNDTMVFNFTLLNGVKSVTTQGAGSVIEFTYNDGTTSTIELPQGTQPDWEQQTTTAGDYIKNKPYIRQGEEIGSVKFNNFSNTASGARSVAEGNATTASALAAHAAGIGTIAASSSQYAGGRYNIEDDNDEYVVIIGNGRSTARANAYTLDWDGNGWFAGTVQAEDATSDGEVVTLGQMNTSLSAKQDKTDNTLITLSKQIVGAINEVDSVAKGANKAVAFSNYQTLVSHLLDSAKSDYVTGQNLYVVTTEVPDLWISGKLSSSASYTYVSDAKLIEDIESGQGKLNVGYFTISFLEGQKVDLTNYYTKTAADTKIASDIATHNTAQDAHSGIRAKQISGVSDTAGGNLYINFGNGNTIYVNEDGTIAFKFDNITYSGYTFKRSVQTTLPAVLQDRTDYRVGAVATLNLSFPTLTNTDFFECNIIFRSGATATTVTAPDVNFVGDDCTNGTFSPASNTNYEVNIKFLGNSTIVGRVASY